MELFLRHKWVFFIAGGLFIVAIFIFYFFSKNSVSIDEWSPIDFDGNTTPNESNHQQDVQEVSFVTVDIKGEIEHPDVYEIKANARIHDVVLLAGGFTEEADTLSVNLAQKVYDEMMIVIPKKRSDEDAHHFQLHQSNKIRINIAKQSDLETLTGIGPTKAQAIIKYREEHGHFQTVEDLLNIPGIGVKTLELIESDIIVP